MKNMKNMKTGVYFYNDEAKNFIYLIIIMGKF